jgi:UDP-N-acetylmuramoylalanine--D-glutamate ligase
VPLTKPIIEELRRSGVPVFGEIELAWRSMPIGAGPILGITGTNGKSTTTALLGVLARGHFSHVFVGGNLGTAFCLAYEDAATAPYDLHVIELSSFQLEGMVDAPIHGAALLNLTPDHLDRYDSREAYGAAKARIFAKQPSCGYAVVNADDAATVRLARDAHVPVYAFTMNEAASDRSEAATTFAGLAHGREGQFTLSFGDRETFFVRSRALRGAHNLQNAMAAALMARLANVSAAAIQRGLDAFGGLPHRLEFVRELNGIEWINDSKATNVDSSVVALAALPGGVWLIAGGKGKGAPYAPLVQAARGKLRGVLTIGADAEAVASAFSPHFPVVACGDLAQAVAKAHTSARAGEIVLLSPACASYDQFENFEHRGETFKTLVRGLSPNARGE